MEANKRTEFMALREQGVLPTHIEPAISDPLVERVMRAPVENLLTISEVFDYEWHEGAHTFDSVVCEECGEMVVERNARIKHGKIICIPCAEKI
jgi:formylmethanofuran dehydrogenase subunit E